MKKAGALLLFLALVAGAIAWGAWRWPARVAATAVEVAIIGVPAGANVALVDPTVAEKKK